MTKIPAADLSSRLYLHPCHIFPRLHDADLVHRCPIRVAYETAANEHNSQAIHRRQSSHISLECRYESTKREVVDRVRAVFRDHCLVLDKTHRRNCTFDVPLKTTMQLVKCNLQCRTNGSEVQPRVAQSASPCRRPAPHAAAAASVRRASIAAACDEGAQDRSSSTWQKRLAGTAAAAVLATSIAFQPASAALDDGLFLAAEPFLTATGISISILR